MEFSVSPIGLDALRVPKERKRSRDSSDPTTRLPERRSTWLFLPSSLCNAAVHVYFFLHPEVGGGTGIG